MLEGPWKIGPKNAGKKMVRLEATQSAARGWVRQEAQKSISGCKGDGGRFVLSDMHDSVQEALQHSRNNSSV